MISFKTKDDTLPSILIILSLIAVIGIILYSLLVPVPTAQSILLTANKQENDLFDQSLLYKRQAAEASAAISARLWKGDADHVGAAVLARITDSTNANNVKLTAFRPQRTVDLGGVIELPYTLQLTGPYPGIRAVMRDIDAKGSKVVLRSVQVSASEEVTGSVTSTLGISAYISSSQDIAAADGEGGDNAKIH